MGRKPDFAKAGMRNDSSCNPCDEASQLPPEARLLDLSYDAIFVRDREDRITYWNRGAEEIYGYKREEALGEISHELLKTDFPEPLEAVYAKLHRDGRWSGELKHVCKDGECVTVVSRWALERDAEGQPAFVLESNNDITERKRAEEALRKSEQQMAFDVAALTRLNRIAVRFVGNEDLQQVLDEILEAAIFVTRAGKGNVQLYDRETKTLRLAAARGFSERWLQFFQNISNDAAACATAMNRSSRVIVEDVRTSPIFAGTDALRVQIEEGILAVQSTPLISRSGELLGMLSTHFPEPHVPQESQLYWLDLLARQAADLLSRKQAEDALREREAVLRTVANEARVGMVMVSKDRRYLFANHTYSEILGLADTDIVGKRLADVLGPVYEQVSPRLDRAFNGERVRYELMHPVQRSERIYEVVYEPRISGVAEPYVVVVIVDVTERKRIQETLEHKVAERTVSLNASIRSLETLLYTIAHDLRGPNRAMQGYAQIMINDHGPKLDEEGRFLLNRISRAAVRNDRLIRDLLEFGRLMHADLPCRVLHAGPAVRSVVGALEPEITAGDARVIIADEWPKVWANDSALRNALTNLLSNALKYVEPGTRPQVRIFPEIVISAVPPRVRIYVEDNGIGVPSDHHERIFEPFQRVATKDYEGTGIGLAIVRKAAERMGGSAGVDSKAGGGSRFWIELQAEDVFESVR